jgi:hypothetical protein
MAALADVGLNVDDKDKHIVLNNSFSLPQDMYS